ncbi:hypothetical protein EVAR_39245_1 [Eumeta japonica]|uniref:Uncharacterized protein n=1 Tax=Eumeta variegata TaxID=151549 RepID=A0A4C1Y239_EUMVA|nr:hypothetical protein EVAR_39245_1 [Eumeta japonica]
MNLKKDKGAEDHMRGTFNVEGKLRECTQRANRNNHGFEGALLACKHDGVGPLNLTILAVYMLRPGRRDGVPGMGALRIVLRR